MREIPDLMGHIGFIETRMTNLVVAIELNNDIQRRILATLDRQAAALDRLAASAEKIAGEPAKGKGGR